MLVDPVSLANLNVRLKKRFSNFHVRLEKSFSNFHVRLQKEVCSVPSKAVRCKGKCTKFVLCPPMLMVLVAPGNKQHAYTRILLSSALEGELQVDLSIGGRAVSR